MISRIPTAKRTMLTTVSARSDTASSPGIAAFTCVKVVEARPIRPIAVIMYPSIFFIIFLFIFICRNRTWAEYLQTLREKRARNEIEEEEEEWEWKHEYIVFRRTNFYQEVYRLMQTRFCRDVSQIIMIYTNDPRRDLVLKEVNAIRREVWACCEDPRVLEIGWKLPSNINSEWKEKRVSIWCTELSWNLAIAKTEKSLIEDIQWYKQQVAAVAGYYVNYEQGRWVPPFGDLALES